MNHSATCICVASDATMVHVDMMLTKEFMGLFLCRRELMQQRTRSMKPPSSLTATSTKSKRLAPPLHRKQAAQHRGRWDQALPADTRAHTSLQPGSAAQLLHRTPQSMMLPLAILHHPLLHNQPFSQGMRSSISVLLQRLVPLRKKVVQCGLSSFIPGNLSNLGSLNNLLPCNQLPHSQQEAHCQ